MGKLDPITVAKFHKDLIENKPFEVAQKHIGSIRMRDLLTLPLDDQELFMKDPVKFFKKYNKLRG